MTGFNALKGTLGAVNVALKTTEGLAKGLRPFIDLTEKAFNRLTISVMGFVTAGLLGTAEGNALAFQMRLLAMEVAGVFLPTFDRVLSTVRNLVAWFKNLAGEQQAQIRRWVETAIATLGVVVIGGKLILVFGSMAKGLSILIPLLMGFNMLTGGIVLAVGAAIAGLAAWGISAAMTSDVFKELREVLSPLGEEIKESVPQIADIVPPIEKFNVWNSLLENTLGLLSDIGELIIDLLKPAWDFLIEGITGALDLIGQFLNEVVLELRYLVSYIHDALSLLSFGGIDGSTFREDMEDQRSGRDKGRGFEGGAGGGFGANDAATQRTTPTFAGGTFSDVVGTFKSIQATISKIDYQAKIEDNTKRAADGIDKLVNNGWGGAGGDFAVVGP